MFELRYERREIHDYGTVYNIVDVLQYRTKTEWRETSYVGQKLDKGWTDWVDVPIVNEGVK